MKHIASALWIVGCTFFAFETVSAQDTKGKNETNYTGKQQTEEIQKPEPNTKQETPVKIIQYIPGSWTLDQVMRSGKDISQSDTVAQAQMLEFNREGRYTSYSGSEKIDSGAYRLNEDHAILYMSSETDDKTQEWNVWFTEDGTMTLKVRDGEAHGERFSYIYRRTSNAARE